MAKTGPENPVDSRRFSLKSIISRLPLKIRLTLSEVSSWLPQLEKLKNGAWRPLMAGILALQTAALKPNQGIEDQSPFPQAIIQDYQPPSDNPRFILPDDTPDSPESPQQQEQKSTIIEQLLEYYLQGLWGNLSDKEKQRLSDGKLKTNWVLVGEDIIIPHLFFVNNEGGIMTLGLGVLVNRQGLDGIVTFTLPQTTDPNQKSEAHLGFADYDPKTGALKFTNGKGEVIAQIPDYLDDNGKPNLRALLQTPEGNNITTFPSAQPVVTATAEIKFNGSKIPEISVIAIETSNPESQEDQKGQDPVLARFGEVGLPTEFAKPSSSPLSLSPEIISQLQSRLSPEELSQVRIIKLKDVSVAKIDRTIQKIQVQVTADSLNVREGPGTNSKVISSVTLGQTLIVLGEANGWYQIQLPNGQIGWVSGQYVNPSIQLTFEKEEVAFYFKGQWFTKEQFMERLSQESLIYVDGLIIDDPRTTELFDLKKSDAPIPQFVKAMRMAGIEVNPEEVINNLQYQTITGADGEQYVIGYYDLNPNPNQTGQIPEGPIPLVMWSEEEGWRNLSLKDSKKVSGIEIGFSGWWPDNIDIIKREGQLLLSAWEFIFKTYNDPPLVDEKGVYSFRHTDNVTRLAKKNGLQLRAQDLFYGVPSFIERGHYSKEDLLKFIERHVRTMVGRYKGKVAQWSVANEIMQPWRDASFLYSAFGGNLQWLELAFKVAREVDPNATLILNDTGIEFLDQDLPHQRRYLPGYNERFYQVVKQLKESEVPIDAVGFQMHLFAEDYTNPALRSRAVESFKANVRRYNELGVDVIITEFDIRLGNLVGKLSREERLRLQTEIYQDFVKAARESGVKSITFFAVKDVDSWLEDPSISGPENAGSHPKDNDPCLFDDNRNKKPAYYGVLTGLISN